MLFPKESFFNTGSDSFVEAPPLSSGFSFSKSRDWISRRSKLNGSFMELLLRIAAHLVLKLVECRAPGFGQPFRPLSAFRAPWNHKPKIQLDSLKRRCQIHADSSHVTLLFCHGFLPPIPVWLSLALYLYVTDDQAWVLLDNVFLLDIRNQ